MEDFSLMNWMVEDEISPGIYPEQSQVVELEGTRSVSSSVFLLKNVSRMCERFFYLNSRYNFVAQNHSK